MFGTRELKDLKNSFIWSQKDSNDSNIILLKYSDLILFFRDIAGTIEFKGEKRAVIRKAR